MIMKVKSGWSKPEWTKTKKQKTQKKHHAKQNEDFILIFDNLN